MKWSKKQGSEAKTSMASECAATHSRPGGTGGGGGGGGEGHGGF